MLKLYRNEGNGAETCFYFDVPEQLGDADITKLVWLAKSSPASEVRFGPFLPSVAAVEIGPRLAVETPFSSNSLAICANIGLGAVTRIEEAHRYALSDSATEAIIVASHLDEMTQEVYREAISSFDTGIKPAPTITVPVLEKGEDAVREINERLGLGMDDWDIKFYTDYFRHLGRNPTDVELFQIGNANSEHSRHWYFRSKLVIGGKEAPKPLFDIVRAPLLALRTSNSIVAFKDNAGVIRGHGFIVLTPERPGNPSRLAAKEDIWHITCTAETHNHPTLVAPGPGAETGSGGRIRDNTAVGRGAVPRIAVAGYCVGNLRLPNYPIPGENIGGETVQGYATPSRILIEGSNGISAYGNRFGEPLTGGFTRTFGQRLDGERREFRKPVLYSGGVGRLKARHSEKREPEKGWLIVQIGGPAYRIGVGGGAASSMMQGTNAQSLDFNSVQRGNAEMENKANHVIRACIDMGDDNPIESMHDQGAGGPSNVLSELLSPAGGTVDVREIRTGDKTMSVLEIWSAEAQERYGLLIKPSRLQEFVSICERERVNCEVVGEITGDGHVTLTDSKDGSTRVRLNLEEILTGIPQKTFVLERLPRKLDPLVLPEDLPLKEAVQAVFRLPQVGSKAFLVHKVDRSVTGLVARQQCCGPAQVPVADVSVSADGYFGVTGAAAAIGEQPIKMLINPAAGARMAVGEMLTNMCSAKITRLGDVRLRLNEMWAAKLPGEGAQLYDAVVAASYMMMSLGIAADGGKDSLSMAAKVGGETVKSPGQMVVLGYAPVPDINEVVTPDFKNPGKSMIGFIDIGGGKNRLGGSSLAQALGQIGNVSPDADHFLLKRSFEAVQEMIGRKLITAYHDRSDGGLIATVAEMCIAANCGANIYVSNETHVMPFLFSEELGMAFEYLQHDETAIRNILKAKGVSFKRIGNTTVLQELWVCREFSSQVFFREHIVRLKEWWEATSFRLELLQTKAGAVHEEETASRCLHTPKYKLSFTPEETAPIVIRSGKKPPVAILREEGINGDEEMKAAFYAAGLEPWDVTMSDLLAGKISLNRFRGLIFPGGFSFMDVFGSGKGWAAEVLFNLKMQEMFDRFYERPDTFSLGVCNGCQFETLLEWAPLRGIGEHDRPYLTMNDSGRFESRWVQVMIARSPSILFRGMEGSSLGVWTAHGEGKFVIDSPHALQVISEQSLVSLEYVDPHGVPTEDYPHNPNGSTLGIAGLCSPDGRHTVMMPHPERCFTKWQWPWMPEDWKKGLKVSPWLKMFQNARRWCLG